MRTVRTVVGLTFVAGLLGCATLSEQDLRQVNASRDLGAMYLERGQVELAIREYRRALSIDRRDADSHFGIGEAYRRKRAYDLAEKHMRRALRYGKGHQGGSARTSNRRLAAGAGAASRRLASAVADGTRADRALDALSGGRRGDARSPGPALIDGRAGGGIGTARRPLARPL